MVLFLTVAAKHCRQAEHSLQLAAGSFNHHDLLVLLWGIRKTQVPWTSGSPLQERGIKHEKVLGIGLDRRPCLVSGR